MYMNQAVNQSELAPLRIRQAADSDLPTLLRLYSQLGMDDGKVLDPVTAGMILRRMDRYPDYHIFLAEREGETVGTFALLVMDNLGHCGAPSAVIEDVVVDQRFRGQGIGHGMMDFASRLCRDKGCYKMTLSSNQHRDSAHRFYESLGFRRHGFSFYVELPNGAAP